MIGHVRSVMGFAGVALVAYGAGLAWRPAGFIVAGLFLFGIATVGALRARTESQGG